MGAGRPKPIHLYSLQFMHRQFFLSVHTRETRILKQSRIYRVGQSTLLVKLIFVNSLPCVCYPQINTRVLLSSSFVAMGRAAKPLSPSLHLFLTSWNKVMLPSPFCSTYCKKCPFLLSLWCFFKITCLCFLSAILQFKMPSKLIAELLTSILKCKFLLSDEKFLVLGKLP